MSAVSVIKFELTRELYAQAKSSPSISPFKDLAGRAGENLIHFAADEGDVVFAKKLVAAGYTVHDLTVFKKTPLHFAAIKGHVEMIKFLCDLGASVDATDTQLKTPLHEAVLHWRVPAAKELLDKSANTETEDVNGLTPLHYCYDHLPNPDLLKAMKERRTKCVWDSPIARLKLFAHTFHFKGVEEVEGKKVDFEGINPALAFDGIISGINTIKSDYPGSATLIHTLRSLLQESLELPVAARYQSLIEGNPVIMRGGYRGHCLVFLVWKEYFAVCNRSKSSRKAIYFFKFERKKLTKEILCDLTKFHKSPHEFYESTQQIIKNISCTNLNEKESACDLPKQTVGNCVWTSLEAGVYAFFRFHALITNGSIEECNREFRLFTTHQQLYTLKSFGLSERKSGTLNPRKVKLFHAAGRKICAGNKEIDLINRYLDQNPL